MDFEKATVAHPVFIGQYSPLGQDKRFSYFFNGITFYGYDSKTHHFRVLPSLDILSLSHKKFGIGDKNTTVIGLQVLEQPLRKVTRIGKYGHYYFRVGNKLYSPAPTLDALHYMEGADAKSFKVVDECYARDKVREYRKGDYPLPAHPPERTPGPDHCLSKEDTQGLWLPDLRGLSQVEQYSKAEEWLRTDYEAKWKYLRCRYELYDFIRYHIGLCIEVFRDKQNGDALQNGVKWACKFRHFAVLNPGILHNASCAYALSGQEKEALSCLDEAIKLRYGRIEELFADKDLQSLQKREEYQRIRSDYQNHRNSYGHITLMAFENTRTAGDRDRELHRFIRRHISRTYTFYDLAELEQLYRSAVGPEKEKARLFMDCHKDYFQHDILFDTIPGFLMPVGKLYEQRYREYRDYQLLNPVAHLNFARALFEEAHHWTGWSKTFFGVTHSRKLELGLSVLDRFIQIVQTHPKREKLIQEVLKNDMVKVLGGRPCLENAANPKDKS